MAKLPFVILAGRPDERDAFLKYADVDNKVLINFRGKTLIENVVKAVKETGKATAIVLVGISEEEYPSTETDLLHFVDMQGPQYEKIFQGAKYVIDHPELMGESDHILYTSGDLPFLNRSAIENYLEATADRKSDFYYSVIHQDTALEAISEIEWGYMKIKDGKFVSGNLILVNPEKIMDKYDMIKFLSENRKSFVWGVLRASPWLFLKLIFGRIRMSEVESLMTDFFELDSRLIVSDDYEIAFDLDKPKQLDYMRELEKSENH